MAKQARKPVSNAPVTPLHILPKRPQNAPATVPQRDERLCACGCGEWFAPTNNEHRYLKGHRAIRFMNDKKDATFDVIWTLIYAVNGSNEQQATRVAQKGVDFYYERWCKALGQYGWKYDTKETCWHKAKG